MNKIPLLSALIIAVLIGNGCAVHNNNVVMSNLKQPDRTFVIDKTKPDTYPSFATAYGNIYSCRYGIRHQPSESYNPPKAEMFGALLSDANPNITRKNVVLERFDVYVNERLKLLNTAGGIIGGAIGQGIKEAAKTNDGIYVFNKILIDANPTVDRHSNENKVGCDDRQEGEYYASEITAGHDVIITWLAFQIEQEKYLFRSYYPYQPDNEEDVTNGIAEAIRLTFKGIAPRLNVK